MTATTQTDMDREIADVLDKQMARVQRERGLAGPQTPAQWDAFLAEWRAEQREFNAALAAAAARRKAVTVEMLQEQLPACAGFQGTAARCTECRVRRQQHR